MAPKLTQYIECPHKAAEYANKSTVYKTAFNQLADVRRVTGCLQFCVRLDRRGAFSYFSCPLGIQFLDEDDKLKTNLEAKLRLFGENHMSSYLSVTKETKVVPPFVIQC